MLTKEEYFGRIKATKIVGLLPNFMNEDSGVSEFQNAIEDVLSKQEYPYDRLQFYSLLDNELRHALEKHSTVCENHDNPMECMYFKVYSQSLSYVKEKRQQASERLADALARK
jgi:hypothetical protein